MQFIYFIPEFSAPQISMAQLDAIGLGHMHGGLNPECRPSNGPDGNGLLVALQQSEAQAVRDASGAILKTGRLVAKYIPADQTWAAGPKKEGATETDKPLYWVGMWNDSKPTEASLRRKKFIGGLPVKMVDESVWSVPIAISEVNPSHLPLQFGVGSDGRSVRGKPTAKYQWYSALAWEIYEKVFETGDSQPWQLLWDYSVKTLQVNYRVGAVELSLLELLGSDEIREVIYAICDWNAWIKINEEKRKNELASGTPSTGSGSEASSPITDPQSATTPSTPGSSEKN